MENQKYGKLLSPEIKINRQYFREMCRLIGIYCLYRSPKSDKQYTTYAELDASYNPPILTGCIFDEHPTQQTLRKMGWVSELSEGSSFIHVDYDLEGLQQGGLFIIPSGLDDGKGRIFRIIKMVTSIVYPSSIVCEIVPEYIDNFEDMARGLDVDELIESGDLNVLTDEKIGPMSDYVEDDNLEEFDFQLKQE